jgi:hypothetical protein
MGGGGKTSNTSSLTEKDMMILSEMNFLCGWAAQ